MKRLLLSFWVGFAALAAHGQINRTSFGPAVAVSAGDSPIQCAVADVDGDGRRDIVIANHLDSRVIVYRNLGVAPSSYSTVFATPLSFASGPMPHSMTLGDIDGDGRVDVVTGNLGNHTVSLFRNTSVPGAVAFAGCVDIPAGGMLPRAVTLADADHDGRADLLVACLDSDSLSLFRNMGSSVSAATFPHALVLPIGDGPHVVTAGDLTGDGRPEIVVGNFQTPDTRILWHTPGPSAAVGPFRTNNFAEIMRLPRGGNALHLGDIDGDGQTDLVIGHWRTHTLAVFRHSDPGGALLRFDPPAELPVGHSIQSVVVRDLDGDSRPELVTVGELSSYMSIFRNVSSPGTIVPASFGPRIDFPSGWNANGLAVEDIQGDGRPDIVFANAYDDNVFIYQNRMGDTNAAQPPVFVEQPESQTVEVGAAVTFSVVVTGTEPFGYRWHRNGETLPDSNADTLTIHSVQPSDAGVYTVVVTNAGNPSPGVVSAPATLTVIGVESPRFVLQPSSQTVPIGGTAVFRVEVTGTLPFGYRWRRNGVTIPLDGPGMNTLIISNVQPSHAGTYSVIVTNAANPAPGVLSSNAVLTVVPDTNAPPAPLIGMAHTWRYDQSGADLSGAFAAPGFDASAWPPGAGVLGVEIAPLPAPINTTLSLGQVTYYFRTSLDLTAAQLDSISQFYIHTLIDDGAVVYVNGVEAFRQRMPPGPVTGSTFAQGVVGDAMIEGPFYLPREHFVAGENVIAVEVHQVNLASSDIVFGLSLHGVPTVNTNPPPIITQQPESQTVNAGETAIFEVRASSAVPLVYRWRRNGVNIPDSNTNRLVLPNVQLSAAGVYTVVVSNSGHLEAGVVSAPATLTVIADPPPPGRVPLITSIQPTAGPIGTLLKINGGFANDAEPHVRVGGVLTPVLAVTATQLIVNVPAGAMYAPVTVTQNRRTAESRQRFNITFPAAQSIRAAYFGPRVDLASGPIPIHMGAADIDGDGSTDLVVANRDGANFTVFRNRGRIAGGFHSGVHFPAGNTPYHLAIADMDGDGRLDVVTADAHSNTASFHKNVSSGGNVSFAARVANPVGRRPLSIAVGDLNHDGFLDVVTGDYDDHAISVLHGTGTGSFLPRVTYSTGGDVHFVAIADLSEDGYPDVITANHQSGAIALLHGSAAGTLAARRLFNGSGNTIALANVDLDDDLDVVVGNYRGSEVRVFDNVGFHTTNQFFAPGTFPAGTTPHQVAVGDLNGDGLPDVAVAGESPSRVGLLQNGSTWSLGSLFGPPEFLVAQANETGVVIADFDHDGRPDVAVANAYANTISWFRNNIPETDPPPVDPPVITRQPESQTVPAGGTAIFTVEATGIPPLGYVWRYGGTVIPNSNTNRLVIVNVQASHAGGYSVQVTNASGPAGALSLTATLTVIPTNQVPSGNLVSISNAWRYEASGTDLGTSWREPNADDAAWPVGPALLGFESQPLPAPIRTMLPIGPITYYFRTAFDLDAAAINPLSRFRLHTLVDDGAVVYINGTEAVRVGMPAGPVTYNTLATRSMDAVFEGPFMVPSSLFVPGRNVIAVEVHQGAVVSGDVVFGLAVDMEPGGTNVVHPPVITQHPQSQTVEIGGTAVFQAQVSGTPPFGYRWRRNGVTIALPPGSNTLIISNVQPEHAGVYNVIVTNAANRVGVLSSNAVLTVISPTNEPTVLPPLITSFTPQSGPTGTVVTIRGENFHPAVGGNRVHFGAVQARVLSASTNVLTVEAPAGATYEAIAVNTRNRLAFSDRPFVVTFESSRRINAGSFHPFTVPSGDLPVHVSMADMEGAGRIDLVVANHYSSTVGVYLNHNENGFLEESDFGPIRTWATGRLPFFMALADMDGAGGFDIITANPGDHTISLIRNTPAGVFALSPPVHFPVGQLPIALATGDLDKDGRVDIVVGNHDSDSITILRQISSPFTAAVMPFQVVELPVGDGPHSVAIGDVDGDSWPDIIVANFQTPTLALLRNRATRPGLGAHSFAPPVHFPRGGNCLGFGDLDGDGRHDLVIGDWRTQTLSVFRNVASPGSITAASLALPVDFALGNNPHTIALSDLDGDARPDIVVVGELPSYMSIFKNVSAPGTLNETSFLPRVDFSSGWKAMGVAAGDLDGDGRPELVLANAYDDNLTVYRNRTGEVGTNEPPVVNLAVGSAAMVEFLSEGDERVIIDPLHAGVVVQLDASACSDPERDRLDCQWSLNGQVIGTRSSLSHTFALGSHEVTLRVTDGSHTVGASFTVQVITPVEAVEALIAMIDASDLPGRTKERAIGVLDDTLTIIPHDLRRADTRLKRAQQKIQAALRRENPAAAELIGQALEQIIRGAACD